MSRFDNPEWIELEKTIRNLDDEAISHIAFLCWTEQMEREQAKVPKKSKIHFTVVDGGKSHEREGIGSSQRKSADSAGDL